MIVAMYILCKSLLVCMYMYVQVRICVYSMYVVQYISCSCMYMSICICVYSMYLHVYAGMCVFHMYMYVHVCTSKYVNCDI